MKIKVAIVGGGFSCIAIIKHLYIQLKKRSISGIEITVFEKSGTIGPGFPYRLDAPAQLIIANTNDTIAQIEVDELDTKLDFSKWLEKNASKDESAANDPLSILPGAHAPRRLYGKYLKERYQQLKIKGKQIDFIIKEVFSEVLCIKEHEENKFSLKYKTETLEKDECFDFCILATGHWNKQYRSSFPSDRYFQTYPIEKYFFNKNISSAKTVCILGTGMYAIDAAVLLMKKGVEKVTMISRKGWQRHPRGLFIEKKLDILNDITNYKKETFSLSDIFELLKLEVVNLKPELAALVNRSDFSSISLFIKEIEMAEEGEELFWRNIFLSWKKELREALYEKMPLSEKKLFIKEFRSWYAGIYGAIPLVQSRKIKKAIESKQLEVIKGFQNLEWNNNNDQFEYSYQSNENSPLQIKEADFVIEATGQYRSLEEVNLFKNMKESGMIIFDELGGIKLHTENHFILTKNGYNNNFYAIGPISIGVKIHASCSNVFDRTASKIAKNLIDNLSDY